MSKMKCQCGHVISNVSYPSPTEGQVLPQQSYESVVEWFCSRLQDYLKADRESPDARRTWIREAMGAEYPIDASEDEVVQDLLSDALTMRTLSLAECEQCGRLHIQRRPEGNEYLSFAPETDTAAHVLQVCWSSGFGLGKT